MGEAKFTSAPWRIQTEDSPYPLASKGEDECEIVCLPHPDFDAIDIFARRRRMDSIEEHDANAALIAAAPILYEVLDQLLDDMGESGLSVCQEAKDMARAALAKARGER